LSARVGNPKKGKGDLLIAEVSQREVMDYLGRR